MKHKKKIKKHIAKKKHRRQIQKRKQQALVVYREGRPVTLSQDKIDLIKNLYAKDATPEEFELFMQICRSSKLDPFKKEIYFVKFDTKRGPQMVIIVGIDGFHAMAARDHRDFAGTSAAKYTWPNPLERTPRANRLIPETATVVAKRTNGIETEATVHWEEYAPADMNADRSDFWRRMPKRMLEKCAEAKALRKAFPSLGNIFVAEELAQKFEDYTPGGRRISVDGITPSGLVVDRHAAGRAEAQKVLDEKLAHGHEAGSEKARIAEETLRRVEQEDERLRQAKNVTPKPQSPVAKSAPGKSPAIAKEPKPKTIPKGVQIIKGNLTRCVAGKTAGERKAEYRSVLIGRDWYTCFHKSMWPPLEQFGHSAGFLAQIYVETKSNRYIEGLIQIGPVRFGEDGRTPIQVPAREPGSDGD